MERNGPAYRRGDVTAYARAGVWAKGKHAGIQGGCRRNEFIPLKLQLLAMPLLLYSDGETEAF